MRNPFKTYQEYVKKTPRVAFDKSHRNNLTIPMGMLVPDLVLDVVTGDSMSLDASFAFNINPMVFPVQTPLRISQYFFYVPWRLTWENYEDYRYNNKPELVHPYLSQPASFYKTGTLADYMGVPTTVPVSDNQPVVYPLKTLSFPNKLFQVGTQQGNISGNLDAALVASGQVFGTSNQTGARSINRAFMYYAISEDSPSAWETLVGSSIVNAVQSALTTFTPGYGFTFPTFCVPNISHPIYYGGAGSFAMSFPLRTATALVNGTTHIYLLAAETDKLSPDNHILYASIVGYLHNSDGDDLLAIELTSDNVQALNGLLSSGYSSYSLWFIIADDKLPVQTTFAYGSCSVYSSVVQPMDISEYDSANPFYATKSHDAALRLNALPFRAYEMTCNCYFRNDRVDPFILDGEVQYNNFCTTKADGADETPYKLWNRNWELDRFTSCLKTPQQGTAPIVGADLRTITFESDGQQYRFAYVTEADGHTVAGGEFETEDVPGNVKRAAMDLVTAGFNIESLREANAMQRYLERNIRRGLRYKDQVKSHTGVDLDAALLDEPEFLGGFSHYVDVRSVTCSSPSGEVPLADIAGQASAFRKASHKISKFFREDGVVLGLVCITPEPVYSQALEKFYLRSSPLDYYNTEFSHLGMQPVPYAEVSPVQMCLEIAAGGSRTYQSVFGYNRPNYDMVSAIDECHGNMRTTDADFVMMRQFNGVPDLSADFIKVKGSHLNDVFSVTDENGHIAKGQVAFQIFMKRPVPAVGEPRLE